MNDFRGLQFENARGAGHSTATNWAALIAGSALALVGLSRRSKSGLAVAGAAALVAYRGLKASRRSRQFFAETSFAINRPAGELYQFWRNFQNLPLFMRHLDSVRITGERQSEWTAIGPLNARISWRAEITDERENQWLVWRTLPDSALEGRGSVEFHPASGGRGTIVTIAMQYSPPGGAVGKAFATIFGKDPAFTVREDLRRFKALMEAGEIPTIEGQSHGPRSLMVNAMRQAYAEKRKASEYEIAERFTSPRRVS